MSIDNPIPKIEVPPVEGESTAIEEADVEKIKKLFGHCFQISKFDEGDKIPVGGESIFSNNADIKVVGDFENLSDFFADVHELVNKYNLDELKEWLVSNGFDLDEKLFAILFAFTKKYDDRYPNNPNREDARRKIYADKSKEIKLSEIFRDNVAECAEIAALDQRYLQQEGVDSDYFSGDVLWEKDHPYSEQHSFIIIRRGDKTYIYDPTNPTNTTIGNFPSLYTTEAVFGEEMAKKQKRFVTSKNIFSKKEVFYGTNNGTNIYPDQHIV